MLVVFAIQPSGDERARDEIDNEHDIVSVIVTLPERADDHAPSLHRDLKKVSLAGVENLREFKRSILIPLRLLASVPRVTQESGDGDALGDLREVNLLVITDRIVSHGLILDYRNCPCQAQRLIVVLEAPHRFSLALLHFTSEVLMSINIIKVAAFRAAVKVARSGVGLTGWGDSIALWPGGTLYATDGFTLVRSLGAHDGDLAEPLLIKAKGITASKGAISYSLRVGDSTLKEHGARTDKLFEVQVSRTTTEEYPSIEAVINKPRGERMLPFDSIRGGDVASAYGLQKGVWDVGPIDTVSLGGLEEGDTILLATMRLDGWGGDLDGGVEGGDPGGG
jgi:hypothetical protein